MTEQSHLARFAEFVIGDDSSELGIARAERDYALHCLERELAIAQQAQLQLAEAASLIEALLGLEIGSGERAMAFLASVGRGQHPGAPSQPAESAGAKTGGGK